MTERRVIVHPIKVSKKIKWKCGCWVKGSVMWSCRKHMEHPNAR